MIKKGIFFSSCVFKRQDFFFFKIAGNLSLKMAVFECIITDLFISLSLLKISFSQKCFRLFSSFENTQNNSNFYPSISKNLHGYVFLEQVRFIYFEIIFF